MGDLSNHNENNDRSLQTGSRFASDHSFLKSAVLHRVDNLVTRESFMVLFADNTMCIGQSIGLTGILNSTGLPRQNHWLLTPAYWTKEPDVSVSCFKLGKGIIPYPYSARIQSSCPIPFSYVLLDPNNRSHLTLNSHNQRPRDVLLEPTPRPSSYSV